MSDRAADAPSPKVSVIIPVYNGARYLRETIESIFAQTYQDFELIVVDDGSTDDTPQIIASYGSRLQAIRKPNGGGASAINVGIRQARGKWIAWLSADDLWEPQKLARQLEEVEARPFVGLLYSDSTRIDSEGRVTSLMHAPLPSTQRSRMMGLIRGCYINGCSILIHRDVFTDVGFFEESDRVTYDLDLWIRIVPKYEIRYIAEPLVRYRVHPGQLSAKHEAVERSAKRVSSRALRQMGPVWGAIGAALRVRDELVNLPWLVHDTGGRYSLSSRLKAFGETLKYLVNPNAG